MRYQKKLEFTRKVTERKILENISNEEFYREDPHLVTVLSTTLNEDEMELEVDRVEKADDEDGTVEDIPRSRKAKFLEEVENNLDKSNQLQVDRLEQIKVKVLDHLILSKTRRNRSRTDSKRKGDSQEDEQKHSSRPRTLSPPQ